MEMKARSVAIIVNTLLSGGAEKQSVLLLNALQEDHRTLFVVLHGDLVEDKVLGMIEPGSRKLVQLHGSWPKRIGCLYHLLKTEAVTDMFTYLTKPNLVGAVVGKMAGVEKIYGSIRSSRLSYWKLLVERASANLLADKVIFNSYEAQRLFAKAGFSNSVVIGNCVDRVFAYLARPDREVVRIISVGRFVKEKDYGTALKAVNELKSRGVQFIWQLIGYGPRENEIREGVAKLGLTAHVEIMINPAGIQSLLDEADIYLSTSSAEGTSNAILEAMNSSLPVVATRVGDNERLVVEEKNGYLHDVGDYLAIANSLNHLISNHAVRIRFGEWSNRVVASRHSHQAFRETYLRLLGGE